MVKFNKKNQIKCGVLALLFSFLTFGIFKNVEASSQGSSAQVALNPVEIRIQNNGNQASFLSRAWAGIVDGIVDILRFFRRLFGGRAATPVVVEESNSGEEEDEEEEYKEEKEKIEERKSNTNDIDPLPEPVNQPTIVETEEEAEEEKKEVKTEIPAVPTTGNSQIFDTPSTSVSTVIHDAQEIMENRNTEEEIEKKEDEENKTEEEEEKIEKMNNDNESSNDEVPVRTKEEIINPDIVNEDDLPKNSVITDVGTEEGFPDFLKNAGEFNVFRADEIKENEEESEMEKGQDKTINNIKNDVSSLSGSPEKNLVPEKENDKIEEEDKEKEEKTEKGRSNTNDINPLPEPVNQPTMVKIEEEEEEVEIEEEEEDKTETPTVPTTGSSATRSDFSTDASTLIYNVQGNKNTENEETDDE